MELRLPVWAFYIAAQLADRNGVTRSTYVRDAALARIRRDVARLQKDDPEEYERLLNRAGEREGAARAERIFTEFGRRRPNESE